MPTLTLIRHAPTVSNEAGIFMSHLDSPITAAGLRRAHELGESLQELGVTCLYASSLMRAIKTAEALFPHLPVTIAPELSERDVGEWAGQSKVVVHSQYPEAFMASGHMDPRFTPPGGETFHDFAQRTASFLRALATHDEDEHIAAVSHNGVIRMMRCWIEGLPLEVVFAVAEPHLTPRTYHLTAAQLQNIGLDAFK